MNFLKMMILAMLSVFFTVSTAQAFTYQLFCNGNRGRVALSVFTHDQRLYVQYSNSPGVVDFPLYEGIVTRATIPYIKIAEQELASIDQEVVVSWPIPQCQFNEAQPLLMRCDGESIWHRPEQSPLQSLSFSTSQTNELAINNTYNIFKIRWGISGENFHHFLAMTFDPAKCQARTGK